MMIYEVVHKEFVEKVEMVDMGRVLMRINVRAVG
jgi:hypothetical protein